VIDERGQAIRGAGPHSWETGVIPAGVLGLGLDRSGRSVPGEPGRPETAVPAARMELSGALPEPGEPRRQDQQSAPGAPVVDRRTIPLQLRNWNGVHEDFGDAAHLRVRNHRGGPRPGAGPMVNGEPALFGGDPALSRHGGASWGPTSAEGEAGFSGGAAGSHLWRDQLAKTRKAPPEIGWRKAIYVGTGGLLNLGAGPGERILRDHIAKIGTNIPGNYQSRSCRSRVGSVRPASVLDWARCMACTVLSR
jgi:hypothetical protein